MLRTLRNRLILSHVLPILLIIPLMGITLLYVLENRFLLPVVYNALEEDATLLAEIVRTQPDLWGNPLGAQVLVESAGPFLGGRATLILPDGRLLASSDPADAALQGQKVELPNFNLVQQGQIARLQNGPSAAVFVPGLAENGQLVGIVQPYLDTSVLNVTRKRIGWLLLLFVTESLTGSVLHHFEGELKAAVALAFFVPLLIGTGGNAGSQTTSTVIRALAVGDIDLRDTGQSLWHEFRAGLLLGLGMAVVAYFRALLWGTTSGLALTVSVSIMAIVVWANALGALLPLLAAKLKIDPTVVSGPAMSTLVDATGLFIYFSIARVIIGL